MSEIISSAFMTLTLPPKSQIQCPTFWGQISVGERGSPPTYEHVERRAQRIVGWR